MQPDHEPRAAHKVPYPYLLAAALVLVIGTDSVVAAVRETARASGVDRTVVACAYPSVDSSSTAPPTTRSAAAAAVSPAVVSLTAVSNTETNIGSGVIIRSDGVVLTNNHLVADVAVNGGRITITTASGRTSPASVVGRIPKDDIAVVRAERLHDVPIATLGSSRTLRVGDEVLAIGNALGQPGTVTAGIVSALRRSTCVTSSPSNDSMDQLFGALPALPEKTNLKDLIQTDAPINPGNSGGALADLRGRVVGICTMALTADNTSGSDGIGFAIPIERAHQDAQALLRNPATGR